MSVGRTSRLSRLRSRTAAASHITPFIAGLIVAAIPPQSHAAAGVDIRQTEPVPEERPWVEAESPSRLHLALGADYTTAYFFRGFAYEDTGLIIQPWAEFSLDLVQGDDFTFSAILATWNSFHGQATDAGTTDNFRKYWFESDVTAGIGLEVDRWSMRAVYNWYTSPSDAWETTEEIMFAAEYADEQWLPGGWTLLPELTLAAETGSVANDGGRKGVFLELGISPGFEFNALGTDSIDLRFPLRLGMSLSNYYEGEDGENDAFGYASAGAEVTFPLNLDPSWGAWSICAGFEGLFLGDAAASYNGGDEFQFVATIGFEVEF